VLDEVQQAVIEGIQLELAYVARSGEATSRVIHPLGLATKGPQWYLVADTERGLRTFRVDRMQSVAATGDPVVRPDGFDLAEAWRMITGAVDELRAPLRARALLTPEAVHWCRATVGNRLQIGPSLDDGRVEVALRGHSVESLAAELAGFGGRLEVLEPPELRARLAEIGAELVAANQR
jgi:predicted DNA-binding transcriptional regulator YafY